MWKNEFNCHLKKGLIIFIFVIMLKKATDHLQLYKLICEQHNAAHFLQGWSLLGKQQGPISLKAKTEKFYVIL